MPEPNGVNLLGEIDAVQPGVPVIMLTAMTFNEAATQPPGAGTVAYLLKPVDPARIIACAEEVLKKKPVD